MFAFSLLRLLLLVGYICNLTIANDEEETVKPKRNGFIETTNTVSPRRVNEQHQPSKKKKKKKKKKIEILNKNFF